MSLNLALNASPARLKLTTEQQGSNELAHSAQQQTTQPTSPAVDRLTTLPPELLDLIFDFVGQLSYKPKCAVICRALLHYTTQNVYRHVRLNKLATLQAFADKVIPNREKGSEAGANEQAEYLGSLVKTLHVSGYIMKGAEDEKEFYWITLLASLPHLSTLSIDSCSALERAVTSFEVAQTYLKDLKDLKMSGSLTDSNVFDLRRFTNFRFYQGLTNLDVYYGDYDNPADVIPLREEPTSDLNLSITHLKIQAEFPESSSAHLATFLAGFCHLRSLDLVDDSETLDFDAAVAEVNTGLKYLSVHPEDGHEVAGKLHQALSRLTNLETLEMGHATYDERTVNALQHCTSLRKVSFNGDEGNFMGYKALETFLKSVAQHRHLKELELNCFSEEVGRGDDIEDLNYIPEHSTEFHWYLPEWPAGTDVWEATSLVYSARQVGVRITGIILEAIAVQEAWDFGVERIEKNMKYEEREARWAQQRRNEWDGWSYY